MAKQFILKTDWPLAQTDKGTLRGYFYDGVFRFLGIKYADAARFEQPRETESWEGIRDALDYGLNCPGTEGPKTRQPRGEVRTPHRYWPEGEHCQFLNVWTDTLDPNAKKAVMVWLHGGGYSGGSDIEIQYYDGDNLARNEDIVVVSLNHRLNVLGFLDVSDYGPQYENSVNAGMADIVEALKWVKRNIAAFGGDPDNVTIFGQSGGGGKVSALEQIPAAAGLFQKAIVMSGSIPDDDGLVYTTAPGKMIAEAIMDELGDPDHDFNTLLTAPEMVLEIATGRALNNLKKQGYAIGWGPQKNGWYEGYVAYNGVSEHSKNIPTIFGTEICEFGFNPIADLNAVPEAERPAIIKEKFGEENGQKLIELYEKAYPGVNILNVLTLDVMFRPTTKDMIRRRVKECSAPNYNYIMSLEFPMDGGKRAWHCADIPFAFGNALETPICNIPGGVTEHVQEQFCKAFTNFAKTGDPNHDKLPEWKACTEDSLYTMIFDTEADLRENF
ncbi:MAG: carboxylesterase/lipase family protein, partial [Lachnospiraceae bacterium]|nr:carboxylesterase/lipase family protein [Lachnospiraceae bacterium]